MTAAPEEEKPLYSEAEQKKCYKECKPAPPPREADDRRKLKKFAKEVEIILQTVNENEYQAAASLLKPPYPSFSRAVVYPSAGKVVGIFADKKTALIQTAVGADAGDYVQSAIDTFRNAQFVIGVGVCYAFDAEKHKFGDVLVSSKISDLKNSKFSEDNQLINCGETVKMVEALFSTFCKDLTFDDDFEVSTAGRKSKVYTGPFASYSALIDHEDTRDKFFAAVPEVIGGEMEGGELLKFQSKRKVKGVIVIKGVANYADGKKEESWQFTAAMAALKYVESKLHYYFPSSDSDQGTYLF